MMLSIPPPSLPVLASSTTNSFLLCGLEDTLLGLDALAVSEIVPLPAIAPIAEKSPGIQGVLNLRGNIVPVLDSRVILGFEPRAPRPSDRLVVLQHDGHMVAFPVDEVHDVQSIAPDTIEKGRPHSIIAGLGRVGDAIAQLLRLETIFRLAQARTGQHGTGQLRSEPALLPETGFSVDEFAGLALSTHWNLAPEDRAIFRARANALARPLENEGELGATQTFRHLAAVKVDSEYIGLDLRFVREFAPLQQLTPVPCSPSFVLGLVNLRGEILTLVDARPSLGLNAFDRNELLSGIAKETPSKKDAAGKDAPQAQIVVVEDENTRLGLAVDEVIDVFTVKDAFFAPAPSAAREEGELIDGTVLYGNVRLSVLDLSKLISGLMSQADAASAESSW